MNFMIDFMIFKFNSSWYWYSNVTILLDLCVNLRHFPPLWTKSGVAATSRSYSMQFPQLKEIFAQVQNPKHAQKFNRLIRRNALLRDWRYFQAENRLARMVSSANHEIKLNLRAAFLIISQSNSCKRPKTKRIPSRRHYCDRFPLFRHVSLNAHNVRRGAHIHSQWKVAINFIRFFSSLVSLGLCVCSQIKCTYFRSKHK